MRRFAAGLVGLVLAASLVPATLTPATSAVVAASTVPRMCTDLADGLFTAETLGDSIGAGRPGASTDSRRWQSRVAQWLPAGSAMWNGAVPGSLVRDYLPDGRYRYHTEFTLAVKPSLVILVFRANDQTMSTEQPAEYSPAVFQSQMLQLVNEIRTASPTSTIMVAVAPWILDTRIDSGTYNQWDYIVALWNIHIATGAVWMDWMRMLPKAGQPNDEGLLTYDLVHPSDTGQAVVAAHVFEWITSYCLGATS
jgi:lysophospholipase L1-like esterase